MNRTASMLVIAGVLAAGAITYAATSYAANRYLLPQGAAIQPQCRGKHVSHQVVVQNNAMLPQYTTASLCDTLTITNRDDSLRLIAFGSHDHHQPYDGMAETPLGRGQSFTITLSRLGTYHFHDHIEDVAQGDFTVKNR